MLGRDHSLLTETDVLSKINENTLKSSRIVFAVVGVLARHRLSCQDTISATWGSTLDITRDK